MDDQVNDQGASCSIARPSPAAHTEPLKTKAQDTDHKGGAKTRTCLFALISIPDLNSQKPCSFTRCRAFVRQMGDSEGLAYAALCRRPRDHSYHG